MRKFVGGIVAAFALVGVVAATAHAEDHLTPGTPGAANCKGQTTAYLAQAQKNGLLPDALHAMGIGGIARVNDISVKDVKAIVDAFCAGS